MKWVFKYFFLFLVFQYTIAQGEEVDITTHQSESHLTFYALNNTEMRHEITLTITLQNLLGYEGPLTQLVPAKDSVQLIKLTFPKDKPWSYNTNYTYKPMPTKEENARQNEQVRQELYDFLGVRENEIILFYGEGCSRSIYAKEMLEKKKIPFKYLNVTKNEHYNKIMLKLLRLQDPDIKRIGYPVFLVNNKLDNDIENLRWYIKELASN